MLSRPVTFLRRDYPYGRMRRDRGEYRDPAVAAGVGQFAVIQSVAPSVGVDVSPVNITDTAEIERAVATFAHSANGGLISTASALSAVHRDLITRLQLSISCPRSTKSAVTLSAAD